MSRARPPASDAPPRNRGSASHHLGGFRQAFYPLWASAATPVNPACYALPQRVSVDTRENPQGGASWVSRLPLSALSGAKQR